MVTRNKIEFLEGKDLELSSFRLWLAVATETKVR